MPISCIAFGRTPLPAWRDDQMIVRRHDRERVHADSVSISGPGDDLQQTLVVLVVQHDCAVIVPAVKHMQAHVRDVDARWSGHGRPTQVHDSFSPADFHYKSNERAFADRAFCHLKDASSCQNAQRHIVSGALEQPTLDLRHRETPTPKTRPRNSTLEL
jgi:hypothetical protein